MKRFSPAQFLWDVWCCTSVIGIWPRYIEPNWLSKTSLTLPLPSLPKALNGLRIFQISDLHMTPQMPGRFLNKVLQAAQAFRPDLIVCTGDFLAYARLHERERLQAFLKAFHAPYGCYAVAGNHDYAANVTINAEGDYDVVENTHSSVFRGFARLWHPPAPLTGKTTDRAKTLEVHPELVKLLATTPFKFLHNQTTVVDIKGSPLNICGLGEHMLGQAEPKKAFKNYQQTAPGLVLVHNPDAVPLLLNYPGEVILSGHTHGVQINLPYFRKNFTLLENPAFTKGKIQLGDKWLYVNRGLGGVFRFRWFSTPEVLCLTLQSAERGEDVKNS